MTSKRFVVPADCRPVEGHLLVTVLVREGERFLIEVLGESERWDGTCPEYEPIEACLADPRNQASEVTREEALATLREGLEHNRMATEALRLQQEAILQALWRLQDEERGIPIAIEPAKHREAVMYRYEPVIRRMLDMSRFVPESVLYDQIRFIVLHGIMPLYGLTHPPTDGDEDDIPPIIAGDWLQTARHFIDSLQRLRYQLLRRNADGGYRHLTSIDLLGNDPSAWASTKTDAHDVLTRAKDLADLLTWALMAGHETWVRRRKKKKE